MKSCARYWLNFSTNNKFINIFYFFMKEKKFIKRKRNNVYKPLVFNWWSLICVSRLGMGTWYCYMAVLHGLHPPSVSFLIGSAVCTVSLATAPEQLLQQPPWVMNPGNSGNCLSSKWLHKSFFSSCLRNMQVNDAEVVLYFVYLN